MMWHIKDPRNVEREYLVELETGGLAVATWSNRSMLTGLPSENWPWHWRGLPQFAKVVAWHLLPERRKTKKKEGSA